MSFLHMAVGMKTLEFHKPRLPFSICPKLRGWCDLSSAGNRTGAAFVTNALGPYGDVRSTPVIENKAGQCPLGLEVEIPGS